MSGRLNIAVIGSGISGLSAAWLLARAHRVTLYEKGEWLGGHTNTVTLDLPEGPLPVDTGFIVCNPPSYPNLTALFSHLGTPTQKTDMSFAVSVENGAYEYAGTGLNCLFGQRRNIFDRAHLSLIRDLRRFFKTVRDDAREPEFQTCSLGEYLARRQYSASFIDNHILPMTAAIWAMISSAAGWMRA